MPKHAVPRRPGPRHLSRLRLSRVVALLELDRADLGADDVEHDFWRAREERVLELGARS